MMFNEVPFLNRFAAAAQAGFAAVEFLFPYEHPPEVIADRLKANKLTPALFNLPPGDWATGERGMAAFPDRFDEFKASVDLALTYAKATNIKRVHMMAGMADRSKIVKHIPSIRRYSPGRALAPEVRRRRSSYVACASRLAAGFRFWPFEGLDPQARELIRKGPHHAGRGDGWAAFQEGIDRVIGPRRGCELPETDQR